MTRTFWLSFTDPHRPVGSQFLGVCVVDVSTADAALARQVFAQEKPFAKPGSEWIGAALRRAWQCGANPGGEVATLDISDAPEAATAPRDRLLGRVELVALGLADPPE
jgi:hypothetical protein